MTQLNYTKLKLFQIVKLMKKSLLWKFVEINILFKINEIFYLTFHTRFFDINHKFEYFVSYSVTYIHLYVNNILYTFVTFIKFWNIIYEFIFRSKFNQSHCIKTKSLSPRFSTRTFFDMIKNRQFAKSMPMSKTSPLGVFSNIMY